MCRYWSYHRPSPRMPRFPRRDLVSSRAVPWHQLARFFIPARMVSCALAKRSGFPEETHSTAHSTSALLLTSPWPTWTLPTLLLWCSTPKIRILYTLWGLCFCIGALLWAYTWCSCRRASVVASDSSFFTAWNPSISQRNSTAMGNVRGLYYVEIMCIMKKDSSFKHFTSLAWQWYMSVNGKW